MRRRRHRPEPADLSTTAEATTLLGICHPMMTRWDECGKFRTGCHPINSYRNCLREDVMRLRKMILEEAKAA